MTHAEAKPRAEREHDDLIWQWSPEGSRFCLTTANGDLIARGLTKEVARRLCLAHNAIVLA